MKRGDEVIIYQDPLTEKSPEGKAKLVKFISESHDMEYWYVRFLEFGDEEAIITRFIKKEKGE